MEADCASKPLHGQRFRLKNGYQNEGSGGCDLAPFQKHATMTGPERKPGQLVVTGTLFFSRLHGSE